MRFDSKHKENLSKALIGRKFSKEHKEKLRQAKLKNPTRYWLKKKRILSEKHKENISKGLSRAYREGKRTINGFQFFTKNNPNKGKFGKEHPKWIENKKRPFYKSIRQLHQYVQWRSEIFKRDNFICVLCKKAGYIEADHYPKRFIDIVKEHQVKTIDDAINCQELWNINNGRTLCLICHRKTDTWGRRKD